MSLSLPGQCRHRQPEPLMAAGTGMAWAPVGRCLAPGLPPRPEMAKGEATLHPTPSSESQLGSAALGAFRVQQVARPTAAPAGAAPFQPGAAIPGSQGRFAARCAKPSADLPGERLPLAMNRSAGGRCPVAWSRCFTSRLSMFLVHPQANVPGQCRHRLVSLCVSHPVSVHRAGGQNGPPYLLVALTFGRAKVCAKPPSGHVSPGRAEIQIF
jgi:hypothetical protein